MFVLLQCSYMYKARGAMKRIQPFTIGTKLSVPTETKCPDYIGTILPVPAVDCCELRNGSNNEISPLGKDRAPTPHNSAPMEELSEEDIREEEGDSGSPSASSRSIRKIAMCGNAESQMNCHVSNCNTIHYETNKTNTSTEKLLAVEERLSDRSASQMETDPWTTRGMKMKNLHYDYSTPAFPHDQPEDASHSQRRDLKDFENSLIRLTTSLDLSQEEPEMPLQKKTEAGNFGLEGMLRRRPNPGDHIDKSWVKLRSLLKDYHQDLILALEVSSFYQQADNILSAINYKKSSVLMTDIYKSSQDKETNEIACQINMLNESVSRLSNIHPTLARRVTFKQAEVKENWAFLQEFLRNQKTDVCTKRQSSSPTDPLTACPDSQSFARNEGHSVMGKDVKEEQNRLRGFECSQGMWAHRMWSPTEECSVGSRGSLSESSCSKLDSVEKLDIDRSCFTQMPETMLNPSNKHLVTCKMSSELTASSENAHLCLKDNTVSDIEESDFSKHSPDHKIEELLSQVEILWEALQKKYGENDESKPAEKEPAGNKPDQMTSDFPLSNQLPESVEEGNSGMLAKFLELLDPSGYQKMSQDATKMHESPERADASEMSLDQLGGQNDGERSPKFHQTTEELQILLSTLTLRINQHLSRCAELSMDLLDIETDMTVLCDPELSELDGLHEQQDDLEAHYNIIEGEVNEMERLAGQPQILSPELRDPLREDVQSILQAWEEVGRNMAENRGRLEKFHQIQDYFEKYLAMITWTENSRSCILAGSSAWKESEVTEIDRSIETKLDEFNKLATAGQMLVREESRFENIIKERTDELQSMLGWIQVNWRAQREQLKGDQNVRREEKNDAVQPDVSAVALKKLPSDNLCIANTDSTGSSIKTQPCQNNLEEQRKHDVSSVVDQESCLSKTSLGSSICLILSFDEQSSGINQVTKQWSPNNNDAQDIQVYSEQDGNSQSHMQESLEMLQVKSSGKEPEPKSPCGNFTQSLLNNQEQPVPNKEKVSSDLFSSDIQSSSCNDLATFQLSLDSERIQMPELSVVHHQNQKLSSSKQSSHINLQTNQQSTSEKNVHLWNEVPAEVTHRVFTYLHVSDSYKSADRASEAKADSPPLHATSAVSPVSTSSTHSSFVHAPEKGVARFAFTLNEPIRSREGDQRRQSTVGIMGLEKFGKSSSMFRRRSNTWPERERRGNELKVCVKKSMIMADPVVEDESNSVMVLRDNASNAVKTSPSGPVKNICSYLSLGSTISFCLPKRYHSSVSELETKEEMIYNNQSVPSSPTPLDTNTAHQKPHSMIEIEPVSDAELTTVNPRSNCDMINMEDLEDAINEVDTQHLDAIYDFTDPVLMQKGVLLNSTTCKDLNNHKSAMNSSNDPISQHKTSPQLVCGSPSDSQCSLPSLSLFGCGHECRSVHTKIKDLNNHLYYTSKYVKINSPNVPLQALSNGLQGARNSARIINCGLRDCAVCFSDMVKKAEDVEVTCAGKSDSAEGVLQPGHWLFQQEEEELEDIWRGKVGNLTSNCTLETNMDDETGFSITASRGQATLPVHV
ncbi:uncharacterized protein [Misgurnus anguillicaudatus]|uniref:uncharacterized protein isoform X1 n=2 Tax=Misgurnus anguillicaudatus TaxID=75329 RepID=UPI003CCF5D53